MASQSSPSSYNVDTLSSHEHLSNTAETLSLHEKEPNTQLQPSQQPLPLASSPSSSSTTSISPSTSSLYDSTSIHNGLTMQLDTSSGQNNNQSWTTVTHLDELSKASLDYFSTYTVSPAKMNQLQGLIASLHALLSDQSYAMSDLRTQLDEIQQVLDRIQPKHDTMTAQERQIVHNAQMMKTLAEEVIAAKVEKRDSGFQDALLPNKSTTTPPLMLSIPTTLGHAPATPPPTATTPPLTFHDQLPPRSTSATPSDQKYSMDTNDRSSQSPSAASSYRRRQQKKRNRHSLRQLESLNGNSSTGSGSRYEQESNAAFERICSLLTHLITDASTAVGTAPDGSRPSITPLLPQMSPLEQTDESDTDDVDTGSDTNAFSGYTSEEAEQGLYSPGEDEEPLEGEQPLDEQLLDEDMDDHHRLYLSEAPDLNNNSNNGVIDDEDNDNIGFHDEAQDPQFPGNDGDDQVHRDEQDVSFSTLRRRRAGSRASMRPEKSANRLSSLFMELQTTQQANGDPTLDDPDKSST
ncbi:hypothetical protein BGZ94_008250, partial [Podila epigama]